MLCGHPCMLGVGLGAAGGPGIGVSDGIGCYCFSFVWLWVCDFGSLMGLVDNTSLYWAWGWAGIRGLRGWPDFKCSYFS